MEAITFHVCTCGAHGFIVVYRGFGITEEFSSKAQAQLLIEWLQVLQLISARESQVLMDLVLASQLPAYAAEDRILLGITEDPNELWAADLGPSEDSGGIGYLPARPMGPLPDQVPITA